MRTSGILLPVASLPSRYGIGCFSKEAYEFVDRLEEAGQSYWQILPLGPTGYGDSPYQSFSTFAGNPYFIDLETLVKEELLTEEECDACDFGDNAEYIDYEKIYLSRFKVLRKAFERFAADDVYDAFVSENGYWLEDYALYMTAKGLYEGKSYLEWPEPVRSHTPEAIRQLCTLKGVGVWTAEMILLFCLQRPDILSYDDLAILRGLRMVYHHRSIDRRLFEKYRRRFSPYGSVASLYLWAVAGGAIPEMKDYQPPKQGRRTP